MGMMSIVNETLKSISIIIITGGLSAANLYCKVINISIIGYQNFQSDMFTVSSVFMGFSVSTLGILLGLYSHKTIEKVTQTNIMLEKVNRFTDSLKYMGISMVIFLASILGILDFLNKKISVAKEYFLTMASFLFLVGLAYYVIASYDLIKVSRILYGVDEEKRQKTITKFKKELRKSHSL